MDIAIILAAGRGSRLHPFSKYTPKPLVKIVGRPLIEYTIQAIKNAGIEDIVVVTGYLSKHIKEHLGNGERFGVNIRYCYNRSYTHGNSLSLEAAKGALEKDRSFLLLMGDHYFDETIIRDVLEKAKRQPLLCIDKNPKYPPQVKDATKVFVDENGQIVDTGKNISFWNAVDTGLFLLDYTIFEVIQILEKRKPSLTISDCIKYLTLNMRPVWGFDISGRLWFDIDTPQDVDFANSFLCEVLKCQRNGME